MGFLDSLSVSEGVFGGLNPTNTLEDGALNEGHTGVTPSGGAMRAKGGNSAASSDAKQDMYTAVAVVVVAGILVWVSGFVFRNINGGV